MGLEWTSTAHPPLNELERLERLLPPELRSWVDITITGAFKPDLISCAEAPGDRVSVDIDLSRWQVLPQEHRDLLFLHQVARIQTNNVPHEGWEKSALLIGLGGAVGEIWVQDTWLLLLSLMLATVAGLRLYRQNRNRYAVQQIYAADRKAIDLAIRAGYPSPVAYHSLLAALQEQCNRAQSSQLKTQYRARLEALRKHR